jgi:hypothetical protein
MGRCWLSDEQIIARLNEHGTRMQGKEVCRLCNSSTTFEKQKANFGRLTLSVTKRLPCFTMSF